MESQLEEATHSSGDRNHPDQFTKTPEVPPVSEKVLEEDRSENQDRGDTP